MSTELQQLVARAARELKSAGAREVYLFGSAAREGLRPDSDLDFAVAGLPPAMFYRVGARLSDLLECTVDLVDLDVATPFTRHLLQENELVRVG